MDWAKHLRPDAKVHRFAEYFYEDPEYKFGLVIKVTEALWGTPRS